MVVLKDVDQSNFYDCLELERKSQQYVGEAVFVLAEGYIFRKDSTTYGIYHDDCVVGLVTVADKPARDGTFSFTNMFIADRHQGKGYAKAAVAEILRMIRAQVPDAVFEIQVHEDNAVAIHVYEKFGFCEVTRAKWDESFVVMELRG